MSASVKIVIKILLKKLSLDSDKPERDAWYKLTIKEKEDLDNLVDCIAKEKEYSLDLPRSILRKNSLSDPLGYISDKLLKEHYYGKDFSGEKFAYVIQAVGRCYALEVDLGKRSSYLNALGKFSMGNVFKPNYCDDDINKTLAKLSFDELCAMYRQEKQEGHAFLPFAYQVARDKIKTVAQLETVLEIARSQGCVGYGEKENYLAYDERLRMLAKTSKRDLCDDAEKVVASKSILAARK